jgi:hypothetical protein
MFQVVQLFENSIVMMNLIIRMLFYLYISVYNQCIYSGHEPDIVVYAQSTDHVSQVVKYCASKRLPVIPFGTGTGLEGSIELIITVYLFTSFLL